MTVHPDDQFTPARILRVIEARGQMLAILERRLAEYEDSGKLDGEESRAVVARLRRLSRESWAAYEAQMAEVSRWRSAGTLDAHLARIAADQEQAEQVRLLRDCLREQWAGFTTATRRAAERWGIPLDAIKEL